MKKMMLICGLVVVGILFFSQNASAESLNENDIYSSQMKESGAEDLFNNLPVEAKKILSELNVTNPNWEQLNSLSFSQIMSKIMEITARQSITPFNSVCKILGIILLSALLEGFKTSFSQSTFSTVLGTVSTISICTLIVYPIASTIVSCANIISSSSVFMLALIPVLAGIMISSGHAASGGAYYSMMMGAGNVVSQISANILVPFLNMFLGISVVGAISPKINLKGVCDLINKVIKWVLTFVMSVFVTILTSQTLISATADSAGTKAARFAISSFVPLVGGALSEAFQTVESCLKMLKAGVGVFAIIGTAVIYIPGIVQCVMWLIAINLSAAAGDIFGLSAPCALLRAAGKVVSTLLAILLCTMVVFIISSTLIVLAGGGG